MGEIIKECLINADGSLGVMIANLLFQLQIGSLERRQAGRGSGWFILDSTRGVRVLRVFPWAVPYELNRVSPFVVVRQESVDINDFSWYFERHGRKLENIKDFSKDEHL